MGSPISWCKPPVEAQLPAPRRTIEHGAHIGILEGLDAEQVRDLIMQRLKSLKTTGLGDERSADPREGTGGFTEVDLQLLREIHQITARLSHSPS